MPVSFVMNCTRLLQRVSKLEADWLLVCFYTHILLEVYYFVTHNLTSTCVEVI